jgi:mRNA interferase RelE/StbE
MTQKVYRIEVSPSAERDLFKLGSRITRVEFERIRVSISSLADQPRPVGVRKLKGSDDVYRIRVGRFRIIYIVNDEILLVLIIQVAKRTESTYKHGN